MRKKLLILICVGIVSSSTYPITLNSRLKHMAAWGAAVSAACYGYQVRDNACYYPVRISLESHDWDWRSPSHKKMARGSIAPGVAMAGLIGWITSYYTPHYRYKWAQAERADLSKSVLFSYRITRENVTQISIASGAESTGLPLVTLFLGLSFIDKSIGYMIEELERAAQEVKASSALGVKIKTLLNDLYEDRMRVRESSHLVKNIDKRSWQKQWEMHNSNQMKEKEISAMKEIANKPQVHFNHHATGMNGLGTTMLAHFLTR
ncbi:hypothetical protein ACFLXW_00015 [Candidatus Dependentiae bacterium]